MNKQTLSKTPDGNRVLYYQPLPQVRADGVCAILVGYRKHGRDYWYT